MTLPRLLDLLALCSAIVAAWLWYRASQNRVRRVDRAEPVDHLDYNRLVVAMNRSQILNGRAALATAVSALAIALKFAHDFIVG